MICCFQKSFFLLISTTSTHPARQKRKQPYYGHFQRRPTFKQSTTPANMKRILQPSTSYWLATIHHSPMSIHPTQLVDILKEPRSYSTDFSNDNFKQNTKSTNTKRITKILRTHYTTTRRKLATCFYVEFPHSNPLHHISPYTTTGHHIHQGRTCTFGFKTHDALM